MLNIKKSYCIAQPFDQLFSQLQEIVESSYLNSKYSLQGNYYLTEPPEFIFKLKGVAFNQPLSNDIFSTSISAKILRGDSTTTIFVKTSTNPVFVVFLAVGLTTALIQILQHGGSDDWKIFFGCIVFTIIILGIDRSAKTMLVASFEESLNIGGDK